MIKEKKTAEQPSASPEQPVEPRAVVTVPEEVEGNALAEMYLAVKRAVLTIREREDDPASGPLFRTVAIDTGQFARLVCSDNTETEIALPVVFIFQTDQREVVKHQRSK